jgi:O-methyltransferase involved in polyketide biosynthesis
MAIEMKDHTSSDKRITLDLDNVQETLLLPLWGRAVETRKEKPLLTDPQA